MPTQCFLLHACVTLLSPCSAVGPIGSERQAASSGVQQQAVLSMVSPTVKALVDAVWAVWSIGASIYDYIHTNAMEQRIHALENVITVHQCAIGLLSAGILALFSYILFKKL